MLEGSGVLVLTYPGKKIVTYKGEFKNDKKHGKGELSSVDFDTKREIIEKTVGTWAKGKMQGNCVVIKQDGSHFHGHYENGKRDGYGFERRSDTMWVEGIWRDNKISPCDVWAQSTSAWKHQPGFTEQGKS